MAQTRRATQGLQIALSGKAVVCCVHDREKRVVTTEEQVMELMKDAGFQIRKGVHFMFRCTCCDNLFVDEGTEPRHCAVCRRPAKHAPAGPLSEPEGVVA